MSLTNRLRELFGSTVIYHESPTDPYVLNLDVAAIYKTQTNLQSVVSFIADNIADLPIKCYDRASDTDRMRMTDNTTALLFKYPNPDETTYELIRATVSDMALYGRCVWLILEDADSKSGWQIRRLPQPWIIKYHGNNSFAPDSIDVQRSGSGQAINIPADKLLMFHNYRPDSPWKPCSPIESLKPTLEEQIQASRFRGQVWARGGRVNAYIVRPKDVRPWSNEAAERFRTQFNSAWSGNGASAGGVPVLEDGMEIKQAQFSAKEAQWAEAKQLSREDVAGVYHINPSLIWHTGTQTYASAKDNARSLYTEALNPWLTQISQRINTFLLPKIGAGDTEYVEFDLKKKLQGSFEEQAQVIQSSVGAPWLTRNEARAMNNLPAIEGGNELIVPLNVLEGGLASPTDTAAKQQEADTEPVIYDRKEKREPVKIKSHAEEETGAKFIKVYEEFFSRQSKSVLSKMGATKAAVPEWFDLEKWTKELADDLEELTLEETTAKAQESIIAMGGDPALYSTPLTRNYIRKLLERRAQTANTHIMEQLAAAQQSQDTQPKEVYEAAPNYAKKTGAALCCAAMAFAVNEAVNQATAAGVKTAEATKTWIVTSGNPRPSHAAMDGETVPFGQAFSNGAEWPQDENLDAEESANCMCEVEITIP